MYEQFNKIFKKKKTELEFFLFWGRGEGGLQFSPKEILKDSEPENLLVTVLCFHERRCLSFPCFCFCPACVRLLPVPRLTRSRPCTWLSHTPGDTASYCLFQFESMFNWRHTHRDLLTLCGTSLGEHLPFDVLPSRHLDSLRYLIITLSCPSLLIRESLKRGSQNRRKLSFVFLS